MLHCYKAVPLLLYHKNKSWIYKREEEHSICGKLAFCKLFEERRWIWHLWFLFVSTIQYSFSYFSLKCNLQHLPFKPKIVLLHTKSCDMMNGPFCSNITKKALGKKPSQCNWSTPQTLAIALVYLLRKQYQWTNWHMDAFECSSKLSLPPLLPQKSMKAMQKKQCYMTRFLFPIVWSFKILGFFRSTYHFLIN